MNIPLPPIRKRKRLNKLLESFYTESVNKQKIDNFTKFNHAIIILCDYYRIKKPNRIRFRNSFGKEKCVGMCYESGNIDLLYPYHYKRIRNGTAAGWKRIVFHEFGHYYLWSNAEEKAIEFELKMTRF